MKAKHPADGDAAISHNGEQAEMCATISWASKEHAALFSPTAKQRLHMLVASE